MGSLSMAALLCIWECDLLCHSIPGGGVLEGRAGHLPAACQACIKLNRTGQALCWRRRDPCGQPVQEL